MLLRLDDHVHLPSGRHLSVRRLLLSGQARIDVEHGCYNFITHKLYTQHYLQLEGYPPVIPFFRLPISTRLCQDARTFLERNP